LSLRPRAGVDASEIILEPLRKVALQSLPAAWPLRLWQSFLPSSHIKAVGEQMCDVPVAGTLGGLSVYAVALGCRCSAVASTALGKGKARF